jgi:hypothetical protein
MQKEDNILILKDSVPGNFSSIKIILITEARKKGIRHFLKSKTSSSFDEITSKIFKTLAPFISHLLTFLYNKN